MAGLMAGTREFNSGLTIAFGPLFDGQALRWHDRDRMLQNPACRELQLFMCR